MEHEELVEMAAEWWLRSGYWTQTRGDFTVRLANGGHCDIRELLADFAHQLPAQEKLAMMTLPQRVELEQIARQLLEHDPWRKLYEEHMNSCINVKPAMFGG
jgi:hypothetical protein